MKQQIQLIVAVVMCMAGMVIIFLCIYIDPEGEIHSSVLVAAGEVFTFAGSLFGIDYHYRAKRDKDASL